jgi:dTMP kinase
MRLKREKNFFIIEGTDGSGKTVQFRMLANHLRKEGKRVKTFDFPQYGKPSAYFVQKYLNEQYGDWEKVGPYRCSVFYAVDRYDVRWAIWWEKKKTVFISNRYVPSNMAHQGTKIRSKKARERFFKWVSNFEYEIMMIPRPTLSIILHVPAEVSYKLVLKKKTRNYIKGGKKRDAHEGSLTHLKRAERTYLEIARMFPKDFVVVECFENGQLLTPEEIHEKVWKVVKRRLK